MIEYTNRSLSSLSDSEKEVFISFILDNSDATIPLREMFEYECGRNILEEILFIDSITALSEEDIVNANNSNDLGAEIVLAYENNSLVGAHMWRTTLGSGYVNSNPDLQEAISKAGYLRSELVVTLMTAVKESHRGKGIGTTMYNLVTEAAAKKGFRAMLPVVPSHSKLAVAFLTGQGDLNNRTQLLGYTDYMGYEMRVIPFD